MSTVRTARTRFSGVAERRRAVAARPRLIGRVELVERLQADLLDLDLRNLDDGHRVFLLSLVDPFGPTTANHRIALRGPMTISPPRRSWPRRAPRSRPWASSAPRVRAGCHAGTTRRPAPPSCRCRPR